MDYNYYSQYILPVSIIIGGIVLGYIAEKIIFAILKKQTRKKNILVSEIASGSVRFIIILIFTIVGLYIAIDIIPMSRFVLQLLKKISLVAIILSAVVITAQIAVGFIRLYSKKSEGAFSSTSIFVNLARIVVYIIGFLIILQSLGISITPILTALGIGGLAVALALQETLSNFFAGLHIIASGQIRVGDYVLLDGGQSGYITDINWRNTTIRVLANNMIVVPNSKLAGSIVTNYFLPEKTMSLVINMSVSYDSDLKKVERVTIEVGRDVMKTVEGGVPDFEPFIRYNDFLDSGIQFSVILRLQDYVSQYLIKHEFIKRVHERYALEGIVIPYPVRDVRLTK
jgi:small-conductance mechanosensitive channel